MDMEVCVHEFIFNGIMIDDHVYKTWYVLCMLFLRDASSCWSVLLIRKELNYEVSLLSLLDSNSCSKWRQNWRISWQGVEKWVLPNMCFLSFTFTWDKIECTIDYDTIGCALIESIFASKIDSKINHFMFYSFLIRINYTKINYSKSIILDIVTK
jgi:hypothetical protein